MEKRIGWVDYVKAIACILVVLGHFLQSMTKASILPDNDLYQWFNTTIYYFHVPLFFICSGFLYQNFSKVTDVNTWSQNIAKKALALGVPYFVFSSATRILKTVFSGSVNNPIGGIGSTLFLHPTAPYWYLYCLFFVFLITPTFSGIKSARIVLVVALTAKFLISIGGGHRVYAISVVLQNEIWFVAGMCICAFDIKLRGRKMFAGVCGILFLVLSALAYIWLDGKNAVISFGLGVVACVSVILLVAEKEDGFRKTRVLNLLVKYTMPIFLMHTLFAAPVRLVLLKVGVLNAVVHVVVGLVISFIGPIVAAVIMKKLKYPEFLLYPGKFIKIK